MGQAILPAAAFQAALWLRLCCVVGQAGRLPSLAFRGADAASLAFASEQPGRFTISETGHYQAVNFLIFAFVSLTCEFAGFTR